MARFIFAVSLLLVSLSALHADITLDASSTTVMTPQANDVYDATPWFLTDVPVSTHHFVTLDGAPGGTEVDIMYQFRAYQAEDNDLANKQQLRNAAGDSGLFEVSMTGHWQKHIDLDNDAWCWPKESAWYIFAFSIIKVNGTNNEYEFMPSQPFWVINL